jgi:hypothetical protein
MTNTLPIRLSVTVRDELGTEASEVFYGLADPTSTLATAEAAWATLTADLDPVLSAQIVRGAISFPCTPAGGLKAAPVAGSRVEQTGVINFSNPITTRRFGEDLPGLSNDVIVGGKINLADAGIAALIALLSVPGASLTYTNFAQQALNGVIDAVLSFRKRRRQLARTSFEL